MQPSLQQITDTQKATWNKFAPGWKKWDVFNMEFLRPFGDAMIEQLRIRDTDQVLDIATGTGEPGLTIAGLAKNGSVTGTDLAEDMLETARGNAEAQGITNFQTKVADACELPFADNSFDVISCRHGFMFFSDMDLAAREMYRVLRPGGRLATSVWAGPEKNFWTVAMMKVVGANIPMPAPPPGAPGMFRCAAPGLMRDILARAGFTGIREKEMTDKADYGTSERYWQLMTDLAAPVVAAMATVTDATRAKIKDELFQLLQTKTGPGSSLQLDKAAIILSAEK